MKEKIKEILQELRPEFDFSEDVDFVDEGMLDSFDIVNLTSELEDAFQIKISGDDVLPENFSSIDSIAAVIERSEKA